MAIDPTSPVPLYHQIAEAIREQMRHGELQVGDALEPMRRAAELWGVNLHTVRHAYAALARDGLLEMRSARGSRVTAKALELTVPAGNEGVRQFVARATREAAERHGLSAPEFSALIRATSERRPVVVVVECSVWQCESHAAEIAARWQVDARPWPITQDDEPEGDVILATYFHYNDIRRKWPRLLTRVRFLTIRVDPAVEAWLAKASFVKVVERDEPTAEAVAADLRAAFSGEVELQRVVTDDPASALEGGADGHVLYSPRLWSELDPAIRSDERCSVVRYEFDAAELEKTARECAWEPIPG